MVLFDFCIVLFVFVLFSFAIAFYFSLKMLGNYVLLPKHVLNHVNNSKWVRQFQVSHWTYTYYYKKKIFQSIYLNYVNMKHSLYLFIRGKLIKSTNYDSERLKHKIQSRKIEIEKNNSERLKRWIKLVAITLQLFIWKIYGFQHILLFCWLRMFQ